MKEELDADASGWNRTCSLQLMWKWRCLEDLSYGGEARDRAFAPLIMNDSLHFNIIKTKTQNNLNMKQL